MVGLKGCAMGMADVVPGVSGGTIAFISGIYEELLGSIKSRFEPCRAFDRTFRWDRLTFVDWAFAWIAFQNL